VTSTSQITLRSFLTFISLVSLLCGHAVAEPKPNVLFIAIDDLRCDLGALGVPHAMTPQLDAFAKTATVFTHHYVQVPTCGASRCALFRGRYPTVAARNTAGKLCSPHSACVRRIPSLPTCAATVG
jgi:iduronate 2-sulfatase